MGFAIDRIYYHDRIRIWLTLLWNAVVRVRPAVTHGQGRAYQTMSASPRTQTWSLGRKGQYMVDKVDVEKSAVAAWGTDRPPGFEVDPPEPHCKYME